MILAIGYPFTRPNYRAALESIGVIFLVPRVWKIKKGKAEYKTQNTDRIYTTRAFFHHSDYPVIGGLLKGWMPFYFFRLWQLKRRHNLKLVFEAQEPTLVSSLFHAFCTKILGLRYVVFSWENIPFDKKLKGGKGIAHRLILRLNIALADGVICGNQKCMDIFRSCTSKPLTRIPLAGLDPETFTPQISRKHTDTRFVFIGALDYRKGLHILIPAFQELLRTVPEARLTIVGSGSYEQELDELIRKTGISIDRFPWLSQENVLRILSESDIFLYPSVSHGGWEEQFGYSMAEASLMELPVIATRTGSIEEVVVDGKTGILVAEQSIEELKEAMIRLSHEVDLRRRLGKSGREFIISHFSNSVVGAKYRKFFDQLHV